MGVNITTQLLRRLRRRYCWLMTEILSGRDRIAYSDHINVSMLAREDFSNVSGLGMNRWPLSSVLKKALPLTPLSSLGDPICMSTACPEPVAQAHLRDKQLRRRSNAVYTHETSDF